jgi:hypothetical protein
VLANRRRLDRRNQGKPIPGQHRADERTRVLYGHDVPLAARTVRVRSSLRPFLGHCVPTTLLSVLTFKERRWPGLACDGISDWSWLLGRCSIRAPPQSARTGVPTAAFRPLRRAAELLERLPPAAALRFVSNERRNRSFRRGTPSNRVVRSSRRSSSDPLGPPRPDCADAPRCTRGGRHREIPGRSSPRRI